MLALFEILSFKMWTVVRDVILERLGAVSRTVLCQSPVASLSCDGLYCTLPETVIAQMTTMFCSVFSESSKIAICCTALNLLIVSI